jgi:hypothetical protein
MIEIAISLAVIGFALVAIIGILPTGMNVQKENRQETVINQDMTMWMNAIRNGNQGLDDLTNYVMAITNSMTEWDYVSGILTSNAHWELGYTYTTSTTGPTANTPQYVLTNGYRIVGLLSTPRMVPFVRGGVSGYYSNYVVALVRSISGAASEKFPQTNSDVMDLDLSYRMISEVSSYQEYDTNWINVNPLVVSPAAIPNNAAFAGFATNLQANLYNIRLTFRWPLFADGSAGNNRQIFRTMVGGRVNATNEANLQSPLMSFPVPAYPLPPHDVIYFIAPRTYAKAP